MKRLPRPVPSCPVPLRPAPPRPVPSRPLPSRHVVPLAAVRGVREKGHAGPQGRVHVWSARIRTPAFGLRSLAGRSALAMLSDGEPKNKRPRRFCIGVTQDEGKPIYAEGFCEWKRER